MKTKASIVLVVGIMVIAFGSTTLLGEETKTVVQKDVVVVDRIGSIEKVDTTSSDTTTSDDSSETSGDASTDTSSSTQGPVVVSGASTVEKVDVDKSGDVSKIDTTTSDTDTSSDTDTNSSTSSTLTQQKQPMTSIKIKEHSRSSDDDMSSSESNESGEVTDTETKTREITYEAVATKTLVKNISQPTGTVSTPLEVIKEAVDIECKRMNITNATSVLSPVAVVPTTERFMLYDDEGDKWYVTTISRSETETDRLDVVVPDKTRDSGTIVHIGHILLPDTAIIMEMPAVDEFVNEYVEPEIDRWYNSRGELVVIMHDNGWENVETVLVDVETGTEIKHKIINESQAIRIAKNETKVKEFIMEPSTWSNETETTVKKEEFNEITTYDKINAQWEITFYDSKIIINVLIDAESGSVIDLNELNYESVMDNFR